MNERAEELAAYFRLMNANGAAHAYREAVRCGVLATLAGGETRTVEDISRACGTLASPTRLLLDVLEAMSLVVRSNGGYALTPLARVLGSGGYRNLGDEYWAHLPRLLKTGEPLVAMDAVATSEEHYRAQAAALAWMLSAAAEEAAELLLSETTDGELNILDVGAGAALWSLSLARRVPRSRVTAVDWAGVLQVARETAARFGLQDRMQTVTGNYHEVELPEHQFDLAILANVTHLETSEGNRALLTKVRETLKPGGRVVIVDVFPGRRPSDLNRTLYALGLALRTEHGRVSTHEELERLMGETGFRNARLIPLEAPPHVLGMLLASV